MVSVDRWKAAQCYEQGYWDQQAKSIAAGATAQMGWYRWRAEQLTARLERLRALDIALGSARIIEVGSGPVGVAGFLPACERLLVDPLAEFYGANEVLRALRNPEAVYLKGGGESLPVDSEVYDLAIIENCIDHVQDADAVMRELRRVLRPGGILYLTVNCRTASGFVVHRVLSRLRLDPGHPHTFTPDKVRRMMTRFGFQLLELEVGSYAKAREENFKSDVSRTRLKARLGISEFPASALARRKP